MGDTNINYDDKFGFNTFEREICAELDFTEAFLGRELEGRVVHSVLNGDMTCEYEITIPEDIIDSFVREREKEMIINGYYNYYRTFFLSGIVGLQEGSVEWIMPKEGEKGPSLAFHVRLHEESWEEELEPGMLLHKNDFQPYFPADRDVICRRVRTKEGMPDDSVQ